MTTSNDSQPPAAGEAAHTLSRLLSATVECRENGFHARHTHSLFVEGVKIADVFGEEHEAKALGARIVRACNAYDSDQRQISSLVVELQNERLERANDQRKIKALTASAETTARNLGVCSTNIAVLGGQLSDADHKKFGAWLLQLQAEINASLDQARAALALAKEDTRHE